MREGFPSSKREAVQSPTALRAVEKHLKELMEESGHTYEVEEGVGSLSLRADAENFAPLLAHLETLLAEANKTESEHLTLVVRGMRAVEVRATPV